RSTGAEGGAGVGKPGAKTTVLATPTGKNNDCGKACNESNDTHDGPPGPVTRWNGEHSGGRLQRLRRQPVLAQRGGGRFERAVRCTEWATARESGDESKSNGLRRTDPLPYIGGAPELLLESAKEMGFEGVIANYTGAPYQGG